LVGGGLVGGGGGTGVLVGGGGGTGVFVGGGGGTGVLVGGGGNGVLVSRGADVLVGCVVVPANGVFVAMTVGDALSLFGVGELSAPLLLNVAVGCGSESRSSD
jgi:hypothetical protein